MIKEFVLRWENNKSKLREYFRSFKRKNDEGMHRHLTYTNIVKKIVEIIINEGKECGYYDAENMTVIDDGDYQGTLIFIVPKNIYQPDFNGYIVTHNDYGSCSGCDILEGIDSDYWGDYFNEEQVNDLITLSLHILQKFKYLGEGQWKIN